MPRAKSVAKPLALLLVGALFSSCAPQTAHVTESSPPIPAASTETCSDCQPPVAEVREKAIDLHGERWTDPYAWLRQRENPNVLAYIDKENAYTARQMRKTETLQKQL